MLRSNRSLSLEEPTRGYPLFELRKLLSLRTGAGDSPTNSTSSTSSKEEGEPVQFTKVAFGGYEGHSVIAMACSNDYLLFRHMGESGSPMIRHLAWFKEPNKKIVAMDFNPSAQWLFCVTGDSTIILIPLYFLMHNKVDPPSVQETKLVPPPKKSSGFPSIPSMKKRAPETVQTQQWTGPSFPSLMNYAHGTPDPKHKTGDTFGSLNDITVIKVLSRSKLVKVTQCLWWRPADGGDYGVVSTKRGKISIVDFYQQKEVFVLRIRHRIKRVEKVDSDSYTYLLVRTKRAYYKLLLEHRISDNPPTYESIVSRPRTNEPKNSPFNMTLVQNFSNQDGLKLSVQHTRRRGCLIGAYHVNTHTFEVFGTELGKFALFVYQLPAPATHLHLTDYLTFAVGKGEEGSIVSIVSNWNAATSAEPHWYYKHHKDSVLQEFLLPDRQFVKGIHQALAPPHSRNRSGSNISATRLPGFFLWTADAIYECTQDVFPEEVFFRLIGQGLEKSSEAESLGKTMGLDVLGLYEAAADKLFDDGHYDRALALYHLSNVESSKLIAKFSTKSRMEDIIAHLVTKLQMRESLSVSDRKTFSDLLFTCYLYCCLNPPNRGTALAMQKEFRAFLKENTDYDAGAALTVLREQGCTVDFLQVAQSRNLVSKAVDMMVHHGSFYINQKNVLWLKETGHSEDIKKCEDGALLRCLPPRLQVKLLMEDISTLPFYIRRIFALLPYLDSETLIEIAGMLDPTGPTAAKIYAVQASLLSQRSHFSGAESSLNERTDWAGPEEVLELWIAVVLSLNRSREEEDSTQYLDNDAQSNSDVSISSNASSSVVHSVSNQSAGTGNRSDPPTPQVVPKEQPQPSQVQVQQPTASVVAVIPAPSSSVRIVSVAAGWNHSCALSEEGTLYTWGKNTSGELGHGDKEAEVTRPREVAFFKGRFVSYVAAGGQHTVAIATTLGKGKQTGVYSWGSGSMGQLGHGDKTDRLLPHLVQALCNQNVIQLAAGWAHTLFLTDEGVAFSCGHGEQGQLGTGETVDRSIPTQIESLSNILQVACGYCHTVLLTELGDVYTCGTNSWGQLGHLPNEGAGLEGGSISSPSPVSALHGKTLRFIAAGSFHTIALTDLENVYAWGGAGSVGGSMGKRDRRQPPSRQSLLQRDAFKAACTPHILPMLQGERIVHVSCGHHHTAAVTADGEVYLWGEGADAGTSDTSQDRRLTPTSWGDAWTDDLSGKPRLVPRLVGIPIVQVACGEDYTLALSEDGKAYSWGVGTYGQLGQGDTADVPDPDMIDFSSATSATAVNSPPASTSSVLPSSVPPPVVPLSLEDWGGYGQEALERVLRERHGRYRPSVVLSLCTQYSNWLACAVIYDMLGEWMQALMCRLKATEHRTVQLLQKLDAISDVANSDEDTGAEDPAKAEEIGKRLRQYLEQEMDAVFVLLVSLLKLKNDERKAALILQVLRHWKRRRLPVSPLEDFLLAHMEEVGYNLALILHGCSGHKNPFAGLAFSGKLYESIAILCMRRLDLNPNEPKKDQANQHSEGNENKLAKAQSADNSQLSEEELWGEIGATLPSNWDRRAKISLPLPSLLSPSPGFEEEEVIAFSCDEGHHWGRRAFYEGVIGKFKAMLGSWPKELQMTASLLLAEYQQGHIGLACPICVYNTLRLELLPEYPSLKPWTDTQNY